MSRVQAREGVKFKKPRLLRVIQAEIMQDILQSNASSWPAEQRYKAQPWLNTLAHLDTVDQTYYSISGAEIVRHFLSNASSWRGETARRIKAELGGLLP